MFPTIIPVAGLGTRSLPASKAIPKEMLPIFDKPIVQYVVEEAVQSGIKNIVFVNSKGKFVIEDHFDISPDLELALQKSGKTELLKLVQDLSRMVEVSSVRQKQPLGLGHAVWTARHLIDTQEFGLMLGDDMIEAPLPGLKQLIQFYESNALQKKGAGVILLMEVPESEVSKYGICELESEKTFQIRSAIEKPKAGTVKSRLAIIGRYLLPKGIMDILGNQQKGALGEIQLTDGLHHLAQNGKLYGCILKGQRFDAGDRMGFLKANLHYYMKSPLKEEVMECLKEFVK